MENNQIISRQDFGSVSVVMNNNYQYAVISAFGTVVVPFGKYEWIDGFDSGLARVRTHGLKYKNPNIVAVFDENLGIIRGADLVKYFDDLRRNNPEKLCHWGIINTDGEEVLDPVYDEVWNFFGKHRRYTKVVKDGSSWNVEFSDLPGSVFYRDPYEYDDCYDDYGSHYGEFAGSYAQDVMGFSDDVINDAFEGDPDLYWNID